ncbi:MAG: caspase family protein [Ferrovibrio sp.]|uniref:caspase family protein n=1 Tax=Ferrovibrio sp. TaxID=1917215 RepID=UPI0026076107|nr:caspase family protein [Ferrovibrio sp.]MCW0236559.1 caspase family protein [Ferrovibrio sp.]
MVAIVAVAALFLSASVAFAASGQRLALVIGNNAYSDGVLKNPINDARAMAATLRDLGFEVSKLENADRSSMQRAVVEFGRKLNENTVGLFYFAGHGMQVRGSNYLIPVKASIQSEDEVEVDGVDVAYVMARMATAKNQFNIVILDACRNNPFQRSFRSVSNGLAAISAPTGTLIAYATAPGSVASDGDASNGIYTSELVQAMRRPGISMEEAFKQARGGVIARTQGKQTPWESSSVVGHFSFKPGDQVSALSGGAPSTDNAAEIAFWNTVKDSQDPRSLQAYLDSYPHGAFERLARLRIGTLGDADKGKAGSAAVASLQAPQATGSGLPDANDLSAALLRDWPAVEAALREHFKANFATYRVILPANSPIMDIRFEKATLTNVVDATTAHIMVEGQRYAAGSYVNSAPTWWAFKSMFSYEIKFTDGKVTLGKYRMIPVTPDNRALHQ